MSSRQVLVLPVLLPGGLSCPLTWGHGELFVADRTRSSAVEGSVAAGGQVVGTAPLQV